jgi:hypothetical protein
MPKLELQKQSISPFQAFSDEKQQQDLHKLRVKGGSVPVSSLSRQFLCSFWGSFVV